MGQSRRRKITRITALLGYRELPAAACRVGEVGVGSTSSGTARHGLVGSMGQVGSAGDNAAMESFFVLLQRNVSDRRHRDSRDELRIAIVTWIERPYHRRRRQAALGRLTPVEYEMINTSLATLAD